MGGGSSKVEAISLANEPARRVGSAGDLRTKLTLISLNTRKLRTHANTMEMLAGRFVKVSEDQVQQNETCTKNVPVSQTTLEELQRIIDDIKHAKRLTLECRATLEPLDVQIDELILTHEVEMRQLQAQIASQQSRNETKAAEQSRVVQQTSGAPTSTNETSADIRPRLASQNGILAGTSTSSTSAPAVDLFANLEVVEEATGTMTRSAADGGIDADSDGTLFTAGSTDSPSIDGSAASARATSTKAADLEEEDFEEHPS